MTEANAAKGAHDALLLALTEADAAKRAHTALLEAQSASSKAAAARDAAVVKARAAGVSAIHLAEALGLSRQQIHKILDRNPSARVKTLRDEVTDELHGLSYADIMPGDTENIDKAVSERILQPLRKEVMEPGVVYDELVEDDQIFVNQGALELAKQRGIDLT